MRAMTGVVLGAVLALGLSACGGGDGGGGGRAAATPTTKDYCNAARAFAGHRPGPKAIVDRVEAVGNASPGEVARAWHDIADAITTYADVAVRSLRDPARPPFGLTPADTRALNARLLATAYRTNLGPISASVRQARRDVADRCGFKIDL
jgi:hypothetical protein